MKHKDSKPVRILTIKLNADLKQYFVEPQISKIQMAKKVHKQ